MLSILEFDRYCSKWWTKVNTKPAATDKNIEKSMGTWFRNATGRLKDFQSRQERRTRNIGRSTQRIQPTSWTSGRLPRNRVAPHTSSPRSNAVSRYKFDLQLPILKNCVSLFTMKIYLLVDKTHQTGLLLTPGKMHGGVRDLLGTHSMQFKKICILIILFSCRHRQRNPQRGAERRVNVSPWMSDEIAHIVYNSPGIIEDPDTCRLTLKN